MARRRRRSISKRQSRSERTRKPSHRRAAGRRPVAAHGRRRQGALELAGRPMLGHVICRLGAQVGAMVINANGDPQRFAAFGLPVVPDTIGGFVGPLAGVLAGMRWSAAYAPDRPLDRDGRRRRAAAAARPGRAAAGRRRGAARAPSRWPNRTASCIPSSACGRWRSPTTCEAQLRPACARCCTGRTGTAPCPCRSRRRASCGIDIDPFFNANTPQELDAAARDAGQERAMSRRGRHHARDRHRRLEEVRQDDAGRRA